MVDGALRVMSWPSGYGRSHRLRPEPVVITEVEWTVSSDDGDDGDDGNGKLPRQTTSFFGHGEAEQTLLEAYRSGRFPHAR